MKKSTLFQVKTNCLYKPLIYASSLIFFSYLFCFPAKGVAQVPPELETQFQQIIEYSLLDPGVKGISACVILPDNSVWTGQAGDNGSGIAISDSTVFYAGSTTKTFIATRIMQLWENGLIDLDASYTDYIDTIDFVLPETTIRQMMNHTSGIYDIDQNPMFFIDIFMNPAYFYQPSEILELYLNQPHIFPPGTSFEYSNSNYIILGTIVEAITENPVEQELRDHVYSEVPLIHTYFGAYEPFSEPYCGLWMFIDGELTDLTNYPHTALLSSAFSAGNLVSYPYDEAWFIRNLVNGNILTQAALNEMLTMNPFSNDYGLGIIGIPFGPENVIYGHNGLIGNLTEMFHCPQVNLTVAVMQNSENGDFQAFNNLFLTAYYYIVTNNSTQTSQVNDWIIYPNPVHDQLNIFYPDKCPGSVELINAEGDFKGIYTVNEGENIIDISQIPNGFYLIRINNETRSKVFKIMKN